MPTIGPFSKPELLDALDLQREKFAFLLDVAATLDGRPALRRELAKGARRDLVVSSHELLTEYCLATGQLDAYTARPWYQFARVLRNAVLHYRGEYVSRWPDALRRCGVTELRWRDVVLCDRVGEVVPLGDADAVALWAEQRAFAADGLR